VLGGVVAYLALNDDDEPATPRAGRLADVVAAATPAGPGFPGLTEARVRVGDHRLRIVIADEDDERREGLRERETIGRYDGMLFVYDEAATHSFTMSTVPVALEIGFYDARGRPVNHFRMEPCAGSEADCPSYPSEVRFVYALETLAGDLPAGRLGVTPDR
jgi:uncharacterized membrane protein (UPF0127 family)